MVRILGQTEDLNEFNSLATIIKKLFPRPATPPSPLINHFCDHGIRPGSTECFARYYCRLRSQFYSNTTYVLKWISLPLNLDQFIVDFRDIWIKLWRSYWLDVTRLYRCEWSPGSIHGEKPFNNRIQRNLSVPKVVCSSPESATLSLANKCPTPLFKNEKERADRQISKQK